MPNQDLFKAYQLGIKETQKNQLNNPLFPSGRGIKGEGEHYYHPHPNLPPSMGKEFKGYSFSKFSYHYQNLTTLPRKIRRAMQKRWKHSLAGIALVLALGGSPAIAADFNVNGGNVGDLIDAINIANGNGEPDIINLDGSVFTLTSVNNSFNGDNGLPVITSPITINGNGSTIERDSGAPNFRIITVDGNADEGNLTLNDTVISGGETITGGTFDNDGGGILNYFGTLTMNNSTISGNEADDAGGGIFTSELSTTIINNSTISGNITEDGGGIFSEEGSLTINSSTISNNSASSSGGGIFNDDENTTTISNSTISGNNASNNGGGIFNFDATFTIINTTITLNEATSGDGDGGGILNNGESTLDISNSIVSGNTAGANGQEIINNATINSINNNIFGSSESTNAEAFTNFAPGGTSIDATSGNSNIPLEDIVNTNLANNGGPTETHALVTGSPALNSADNGICSADPINNLDQRGITRPQNGTCDRGAFEFLDENNNDIDDCIDIGEFQDLDQDGISDFCDTQIGDIAPAPTMSQWGMIAFGFIAGLFGLRFLRKKKLDPETSSG